MVAIPSIDDIKRQFGASAAGYAEPGSFHERYAERLVELAQLQRGALVIDAACGTGAAAFAVARAVGRDGHVVGIDVSEKMIDEALQRQARLGLPNIEFLVGDAADLTSLAPGSVDAVVCSSAIIYLPLPQTLAEWARVLRPEGIVAFSTMRADSPRPGVVFREAASEIGLALPNPNEILGSATRCREMLHRAGFAAVTVVEEAIELGFARPDQVWESNSQAAAHAPVRDLSASQLETLRARYLARLTPDDLAAPAQVLYARARVDGAAHGCAPAGRVAPSKSGQL